MSHAIDWQTPAAISPDLNGPLDAPLLPWPEDFPGRSIFACFETLVAADPAALAATDGTTRWSRAELHAEVLRLAGLLAARAPGRGAIGLLLPSGPLALAAVLACSAAGRPGLLLNPHNPAERNLATLRDAAPDAVLAVAATRLTATDWPWLDALAPAAPLGAALPRLPLHAPALVIYTSGSTGQPKGMVLSERIELLRAWRNARLLRLHPADRMLVLNGLSSIAGLGGCMAALLSGTGVLMPDLQQQGARRVLRLAQQKGATVMLGIPAVLRMLLALDGNGAATARLRAVRTTGTGLLALELAEWRQRLPPGCRITLSYGQTEVAIADWWVPDGFVAEAAALPGGYMLDNIRYAILDPAGQPVPPGEAGELLVSSEAVLLGEWHGGRCLPGAIRPDPADPSRRVMRTGDLVRLRPDGLLQVLGRCDRQAKVRGVRVELAEVEAVLRATPGVADAVVVASRAEAGGGDATLLGFVLPAPGTEAAALPAALRQALARALPAAMHPAALHCLAAFPRLPGGKVDEAALLAAAEPAAPG